MREQKLIEQGLEFQKNGNPESALDCYQQALQFEPGNPNALNLAGVANISLGLPEKAIEFIERAVELVPESGYFRLNLAKALVDSGKHEKAMEEYGVVLQIDPNNVPCHFNLGLLLRKMGRFEESLSAFRNVLRIHPEHANAKNSFVLSLRALGRQQEALEISEAAFVEHPKHLGIAANLGSLLSEQGRGSEAIRHYIQALKVHENDNRLLFNLGNAQLRTEDFESATATYRQLLKACPEHAEAIYNLAVAQMRMGSVGQAKEVVRQLLRRSPSHERGWNLLASLYVIEDRFDQARECFESALKANPSNPGLRQAKAMCLLSEGNFAQGWCEYESRLKKNKPVVAAINIPRYEGGDLDGKNVLLTAEQGFGDTIQFVRYASLLDSLFDCSITLGVPKRLVRLLAGSLPFAKVISELEVEHDFDCYSPLMSLPLQMRHFEEKEFPRPVSYLAAEKDLVEKWRNCLGEYNGLSVGIVWKGNPSHETDYFRSCSLASLSPLFRLEGCRFVVLQKGEVQSELEGLSSRERKNIIDLSNELDLGEDGFVDSAAVISGLDLVVSVDTSIAHLAGALGKPVWIALGPAYDWRWHSSSERVDGTTVWYSSAKLFRQKEFGNWNTLYTEMAKLLAAVVIT